MKQVTMVRNLNTWPLCKLCFYVDQHRGVDYGIKHFQIYQLEGVMHALQLNLSKAEITLLYCNLIISIAIYETTHFHVFKSVFFIIIFIFIACYEADGSVEENEENS